MPSSEPKTKQDLNRLHERMARGMRRLLQKMSKPFRDFFVFPV